MELLPGFDFDHLEPPLAKPGDHGPIRGLMTVAPPSLRFGRYHVTTAVEEIGPQRLLDEQGVRDFNGTAATHECYPRPKPPTRGQAGPHTTRPFAGASMKPESGLEPLTPCLQGRWQPRERLWLARIGAPKAH
jgi:hypothetical protein